LKRVDDSLSSCNAASVRALAGPTAIEATYERLARFYDVVYGLGLQPGRQRALLRLAPGDGERILEIGIGTGLSALGYPRSCRVVGIDLSAAMLGRARTRLVRRGLDHVSLCRMDAAQLAFPDGYFHAIYAPYVINVVSDPVAVAREMLRVCRPGGRLVLLNHFAGSRTANRMLTRIAGRLATRATGVNWNLELDPFLAAAGLAPRSIEAVNLGISSVVVCLKR
jgi:phosphatidylethanolamine/phosphatidyl-N-methylethanolamine N-methyltransferase